MIKARFYVASVTQHASFHGTQVKLQAVSRGPENAAWAEATPTGNLEMSISNEVAAAWFVDRLGKDVTLSFNSDDDEKRTSAYGS